MAKPTTKTKLQSPHEILAAKASAFMEQEQALLKKHGIIRRIIVTFPNRTNIPITGKLAVWLLKKSKGVIDTEFALMPKK